MLQDVCTASAGSFGLCGGGAEDPALTAVVSVSERCGHL